MINPEFEIRDIAKKFANSYSIAVFACCREVLNRDIHCGGITKQKAKELLEIYQRKARMMDKLGKQVREKFIAKLDLDKMKLLAIRLDYLALEDDEGKKIKNRGGTLSQEAIRQNFIMLFGCRPGKGVVANT